MSAVAGLAGAAERGRPIAVEQLPQGFAVGDARAPLGLAVVQEGESLTAHGAAEPSDAHIVLSRSGPGNDTSISVKSSLAVTVKYDLYISPDGKRFFYTSSCPLPAGISGFEMWPHPIHSFAIGNPRVVAESAMTCE
jgi:hypothetical protein